MKRKFVISIISLACALVLCVTVVLCWLVVVNTSLNFGTYAKGLTVEFSRKSANGDYYTYGNDNNTFTSDSVLNIGYGSSESTNGGISAASESTDGSTTAQLSQEYKLVISNAENSEGNYSITFGFANMLDYLFNKDLIEYYYTAHTDKQFVDLKVDYNDDKVFGDTEYNLYDSLNYTKYSQKTIYGATARLLYCITNYSAKVITTKDGATAETTIERQTLVNDTESADINLWRLSGDDDYLYAFELSPGQTFELTFTLEYKTNTAEYTKYINAITSNQDYIDKVKEIAENLSNDTAVVQAVAEDDQAATEGEVQDTDAKAKAYLAAITKKEEEILYSGSEMNFYFDPQITIKQIERTN